MVPGHGINRATYRRPKVARGTAGPLGVRLMVIGKQHLIRLEVPFGAGER
jgi:hypothetical protein